MSDVKRSGSLKGARSARCWVAEGSGDRETSVSLQAFHTSARRVTMRCRNTHSKLIGDVGELVTACQAVTWMGVHVSRPIRADDDALGYRGRQSGLWHWPTEPWNRKCREHVSQSDPSGEAREDLGLGQRRGGLRHQTLPSRARLAWCSSSTLPCAFPLVPASCPDLGRHAALTPPRRPT